MFGRNHDNSDSSRNTPSVFWALFGIRGRISRASFLWGNALLLSVLAIIVALIVNTPEDTALFTTWGIVLIFFGAYAAWGVFALSLKRLNDIGWPQPVIICLFFPPATTIFLIVLAVIRGSSQENEHGPPPFG